MRLFEQKGFLAATTPEIALAAGVSHGSVFAHFRSKEELLLEVIGCFLRQADLDTRRTLKSCGSFRKVLKAHLAAISPYEQLYAHLIRESSMLPIRLRALLTEMNSAVASHMIEALEREDYQGVPRAKRFFVFNAWFGTVSHYLLNRDLFVASGSVLEQQGDQIIRLFISMVQSKEGKIK